MQPRLLQSAAPCGRRPQSCPCAWSSTAQPLSPKLPAGAGVLKTLLLYPMELAYTRLAADATPRGQPVHYFGMLHCIVQVAPTACASVCSNQFTAILKVAGWPDSACGFHDLTPPDVGVMRSSRRQPAWEGTLPSSCILFGALMMWGPRRPSESGHPSGHRVLQAREGHGRMCDAMNSSTPDACSGGGSGPLRILSSPAAWLVWQQQLLSKAPVGYRWANAAALSGLTACICHAPKQPAYPAPMLAAVYCRIQDHAEYFHQAQGCSSGMHQLHAPDTCFACWGELAAVGQSAGR